MEDHEAYYQMIYPEGRKIRGDRIVQWATDIAEDEGLETPGSVKEAIKFLSSEGVAEFATDRWGGAPKKEKPCGKY